MTALSQYFGIFALLSVALPFTAKADQISFSSGSGLVTYCVNSTCPAAGNTTEGQGSVVFDPTMNNAQVSGSAGETGIFSEFAGAAATFYNFNYLGAPSSTNPLELFSVTLSNGNSLVYDVTSMTTGIGATCQTPTCLTVTGTGVYYITNNGVTTEYTDSSTDGFTFRAQGGGNGVASNGSTPNGTGSVSFSDTNILTVTPEPSSLLLMGTGLVGMGGALLRRRRQGDSSAVTA